MHDEKQDSGAGSEADLYKVAQEALRASEQRSEKLSVLIPAAVYTCDAAGKIDWYNPRAAELWGREPVLGETQEMFCGSFRLWTLDGELIRHEDSAMAASVRDGRPARDVEVVIEQPSGARVFAVANIDPLFDEQGRPGGAINVLTDVTAIRRATEALRESEARFRHFAEASTAALWIRDPDTLAMEYASPAIATVYGVSPEDILGDVKHYVALVLPEDRDTVLTNLKTVSAGTALKQEFRIQRPSDGAFRWIRNTDFPIRDAKGRVERIAGIAQDVTEFNVAIAHKAILVHELQHRVRNILASIRSIAAQSAERARSVPDYAAVLDGRLMALARVQSHLTRADNIGVSLVSILEDELRAQAQRMDQYALNGPDLILPPRAAEVLTLVVHELTTNAHKHGALSVPTGKITVTWTTFEKRGTDHLSFDWVEDGAPPQAPVERSARRRQGFGTELIESRIPYDLGGRGQLSIEPGGARCHFEIPLRYQASILETDAPQEVAASEGSLDMTGEADLTGRRILVVEDDYYLAADLARALRGTGAEVLGPCPSEQAAMDEIEDGGPDAAVLDLNLGIGISFTLAEALSMRNIPLVFTTGYDTGAIPDRFTTVPCLQKPLKLREVIGAISAMVDRSSLSD